MSTMYNQLPLVDRLRAYCQTKTGIVPSITFGEHQPSYHLFGGFLDSFAHFFIEEHPIRMRLRCKTADLDKFPEAKVSHRSTKDWQWIDIWLNDEADESVYYQLIDKSYEVIIRDADKFQMQIAEISEQSPNLDHALQAFIDLYNLAHRRNEIISLVEYEILMQTYSGENTSFTLGQSRIGGMPDLPPEIPYPQFRDRPLAFLAQVNLAEVPQDIPRGTLPDRGLLYFFSAYGWHEIPWDSLDEKGFSQVVYYSDDTSSLIPQNIPTSVLRRYKPAPIKFGSVPSLPSALEFLRDPILLELNWSEDEFNQLDELCNALSYAQIKQIGRTPQHKLLGYATPIQVPVTTSLETRLLCQIDSDYHNLDTDMMWGDGGMIYFTIPIKDFSQLNFDQIRTDFQSG
jgi:uncharacterized protein YwqG/predicted DNA-binding protein (MmcQ/YjbR family)